MKVIFLPKVRKQFEDLIPVLYENEYFGFIETAQKYVDDPIRSELFCFQTVTPQKLGGYFV